MSRAAPQGPKRAWYLAPGPWLNLLVIVGLGLSFFLVTRWRQGQFEGHGLKATYFERADFTGPVLWKTIEPVIDFSDKNHPLFKRPMMSVEWSGTLVLPRDGRYVFATESDDGSWLEIDGETVVNNGGIHGKKKVEAVKHYRAGPRAIRIRYFQIGGDAVMRVLWTAGRRRGGLEYLPPTLLFPAPPTEVDAAKSASIPPRDLPAVGLLGLSALLCCLILGRRPLRAWLRRLREERWARLDLLAFAILFGVGLVYRLWNLSGVGQTWDEDVYWTAGRNFVQNLLGGTWNADYWRWNLEHPAMAKWIYGAASLISEELGPARAIAAILGALTCAFVFLAGRDMISRRVGLLGGVLCVVMPHVVAHGKISGLEAPSGFFFTLAGWLFFSAVRRKGNTGYYLAAGLCAGLAAATRLTNITLLLVLLVLYLASHWEEIQRERRFPVSLTLGLMPLVMLITFVGIWPYLWENPLQHLGRMLVHWKPDTSLEFFLGKEQKPPLYYFPLYLAVTMPVGALVATFFFFGRAIARRDLGHLCLLLWLVAPLLVAFSPMARDGVRYIYPAVIAACLVAAAGLDWAISGLSRLLRRPDLHTPLLSFVGAGLVLYVLRCGLAVHPYYLDYYNEFVGGSARVEQKRWFEIAWWGEGLGEAAEFLNRNAQPGARVYIDAQPRHVINLRPDLEWTDQKDADYILYNRLFNADLVAPNYHVVTIVRAGNAPLAWIYEKDRL